MAKKDWRFVQRYPGYEINRSGDVRNLISGEMAARTRRNSTRVFLYKKGVRYEESLETLVGEAFPELLSV